LQYSSVAMMITTMRTVMWIQIVMLVVMYEIETCNTYRSKHIYGCEVECVCVFLLIFSLE